MDELSIGFVIPPNLDLIEVGEQLSASNSVTSALATLNVNNALNSLPVNAKQTTLLLSLTFAGEKVQLELQPRAIPMVMLEMFSAGGWEAVSNCKTEILQAAFLNVNSMELRQEVVSHLYSGTDFVNNIVKQLTLEIFEAINLLSTQRINKKLSGIKADKIRYGYPNPQPKTSGATRGSGHNSEDTQEDDLTGSLNINEDAKSLIQAIKSITDAYKIYRYESNLRREASSNDFPEGFHGTPLPDDLFKIQEDAFFEIILQAVSPPNLHTIAPYVMAQIWQQSLSDEEILRTAFTHLRDTQSYLDQAITREDQTDGLKNAIDVSVEARAREAGVKTELHHDSITTRAMMWARNHMQRGYQYEPLADELLLIQLLGFFQKKLESESDNEEETLKTILLIKTLASLMESIDFIEEIEQKEQLKTGSQSPISTLNDLSIISSIAIGVLTFLAPEVAVLAVARNALSKVFLALMLGSYVNVINEVSLSRELIGRQLAQQFINAQNSPAPSEIHDIACLIAQKPSYIYVLMAHTANIAVSLVVIKGIEKGVSYLGLKGLSKMKGVPLSTRDIVKVDRKLSITFGLALDTYFLNEAS